ARLHEAADDLDLPPAVLTFDPHPREYFAPDRAPPRLSTVRAKLDAFRAFGVRHTHVARFDARLANLEPEAFVAQVLAAGLGVRPTVQSGALPLLEVFLFDFDASIYGRRITVEFVQKLRDEERYPDLDTLARQIRADVARARDVFAATR